MTKNQGLCSAALATKEAMISVAHGLPEIEHLFLENWNIHSNNHKLCQPTTHDKDENLDFRFTDALLPLYFKELSRATRIVALCSSGRFRRQKMKIKQT